MLLGHYLDMEILKNHSIFSLILIRPSEAFRRIFEKRKSYIAILFILGGIAHTTQSFWSVETDIIYFSSVLGSTLIALLIGWVGYYLFGMAIHFWLGLFGGKADLKSTLTVLAWSFVPSIVGLVLYMICYASFGEHFFRENQSTTNIDIVKTIVLCFRVGLGIWATYIFCKGLMLINRFGPTKTLYTLLLLIVALSIIPFLLFIWGNW